MSAVSPRDDSKRLWAYRIDPAQSPKQIDLTTQFDTVLKGIYTFEGDRLFVCVGKTEDDPRPTAFEAPRGSDQMLYRLKMVHETPAPVAQPVAQPVTPKPAPQPSADELASAGSSRSGGCWSAHGP